MKRYAAEPIRIHTSHCERLSAVIPGHKLTLEAHYDQMLNAMVYELEYYFHALPKQKISIHRQWPATWWDAFKERWLPGWVLGWFPVQYERIDVEQQIYGPVCPHLVSEKPYKHLKFMVADGDAIRAHPSPFQEGKH